MERLAFYLAVFTLSIMVAGLVEYYQDQHDLHAKQDDTP